MRRVLIVSLMLAIVSGRAHAGGVQEITGCGGVVLSGFTGIVANDIDCTGGPYGVNDVYLQDGATLEMAGHSIQGGFGGVNCVGRCTINGPGEIAHTETGGISIQGKTRVEDLSIHDNEYGIIGYDNYVDGKAYLTTKNVSVEHNSEIGVLAETLLATDTSVSDNGGEGLYGSIGITVVRLRGSGLTVNGNIGSGIRADAVAVQGLLAQGNGGAGVEVFTRAVLRDSTVTGNNGLGSGIDLLMYRNYPRLRATTCGRSARSDGSSLGICANDP